MLKWIIPIVLMIAASLVVTGCQQVASHSFTLETKETKLVIDPTMFKGQVRAAYAAAKKYPDMLNEVFCYCFCDQPPLRHHTLLSCFTDRHGAGCALCQKEALRVAQLHEQGESVNEIKRTIDEEFGS